MRRRLLAIVLASLLGVAGPSSKLGADTTVEENIRLARTFTEEVYNQGRKDRIAAYIHPEFVDRSPGAPKDAHGVDFVIRQYETTYTAFPDLRFEIGDVFGQDDKVVMRWNSRGHFTGTLAGVRGQGQAIEVSGISIFRVRDRKFIDSWDLVDRLSMLRQAGFQVVPPAAASGAPAAADSARPRKP
jgi:predicted ester cyclase